MMRAHIDAVKSLLAGGGVTAYWVDVAVSPVYPYALLWGPSWGDSAETTLGGCDTDMDRSLMVTCVAANPDVLLTFVDRVKSIMDGSSPLVAGRSTDLRYVRSETTDVDRTVTIPPTNRHPAFAVEAYRYRSTPL